MSIKRNSRLNEEMKRIISEIIRRDVKDPRISDLLTITDIMITEDLKTAKVYVSIYGESEPTIDVLNNAKGFIRRELSKRMKIRTVPELFFEKDYSIEKGIYISSLINKVVEEDLNREKNEDKNDTEQE